MRFAMLQIQVGLAHLFNSFKVIPSEKTMIPVKFNPNGVVLGPHEGLFLTIEKSQ